MQPDPILTPEIIEKAARGICATYCASAAFNCACPNSGYFRKEARAALEAVLPDIIATLEGKGPR